MTILNQLKLTVASVACAIALATSASAEEFNIPAGNLKSALSSYAKQTSIPLLFAGDAVSGVPSDGARGELSPEAALSRILAGTGFAARKHSSAGVTIVRDDRSDNAPPMRIAAASVPTTAAGALETVTVTSSKLGGADIQNIPISITALSQEQLTATQTTGGPDLVKQVPNLTFTKTNFTGYSIQIRGIGTQAISVTTDPAVAVAFNDIPFIRNHFFEQEFYDVSQVEVLRGPQGTLYGRNATAGVVNLVSAKPTDQFEAMASADVGNYGNRRFEGMINIPIVDDRADLRVSGEWTKRQGYSLNELTDDRIDGRDLWSGRVTLGFKPTAKLQTTLIWEHFSEDDDRMRTAKQLCKTAPIPASVDGVQLSGTGTTFAPGDYLSQGCLPTSLYSADAFEVPNGYSLPYYSGLSDAGAPIVAGFDPYASTTQSQNLRVIESSLNPIYKAKNDTVEFNTDYAVTSALTFTSQTGFNHDFLWSMEDYNRFNSAPGAFDYSRSLGPGGDGVPGLLTLDPVAGTNGISPNAGVFCDPQLGCSDRLVAEDLSDEHAWQLSQEFRLTSNFSGPLNFSVGGNYLHYETEENYYVFINTLTVFRIYCKLTRWLYGSTLWSGVSDNSQCLPGGL